jgi:hypothetical protein
LKKCVTITSPVSVVVENMLFLTGFAIQQGHVAHNPAQIASHLKWARCNATADVLRE